MNVDPSADWLVHPGKYFSLDWDETDIVVGPNGENVVNDNYRWLAYLRGIRSAARGEVRPSTHNWGTQELRDYVIQGYDDFHNDPYTN